jgi:inosose dehydratase
MVYGEVANSIQGSSDPLYKRPRFLNELEWRQYASKLTAFANFTLSRGVRLAYHHHMGAYVETPSDIERLMSLTGDEVGLLFDSGHIMFSGGDPLAVLKQHIDRVCHVHCKDVRSPIMKMARNRNWSFLQSVVNGVFTVPGDGAINFSKILHFLSQNCYEGWLVVEAEQDPVVAPSYQYAQVGYHHLYDLVQHISNGKII